MVGSGPTSSRSQQVLPAAAQVRAQPPSLAAEPYLADTPIVVTAVRWVVAIEADRPDRKLKAHGTGGRMHAYDLLEVKLAHPLAVRHTVNPDLMGRRSLRTSMPALRRDRRRSRRILPAPGDPDTAVASLE